MAKLADFKDLALDILFPKFCAGCGKQGKYICGSCELFISESSLICPVCGKVSFTGETHFNCNRGYKLDGLTSVWDYEGIIKKLIKNVKYGGAFDAINELLEKSFRVIINDSAGRFASFLQFMALDNTYITYVPMFFKKEKRRGFNQAEIIAKKIGKKINKPVIGLIDKIRETEDQASLNKEKRKVNLKDNFKILQGQVPNCLGQALVVDDVFTTGATMQECCKVLKKAGAKKVWGFALAKTI